MAFSSKTARWVSIVGILLVAGCTICPVHSRLLQAGAGAGFLLALSGLFPWSGRSAGISIFMLPVVVLGLTPFLLPGKSIDPNLLRAEYVARMRGYIGCGYVWGGESSLGIDCSGLPRRALRDALMSEGWRHANGAAFRMWLEQWWFDSSALAMREGYRGITRPLGISGPLWDMDQYALLPGDLAVRGDGHHVVVFLGDHLWIEADPNIGKVHVWKAASGDGKWYQNMTMHRWLICEPN